MGELDGPACVVGSASRNASNDPKVDNAPLVNTAPSRAESEISGSTGDSVQPIATTPRIADGSSRSGAR